MRYSETRSKTPLGFLVRGGLAARLTFAELRLSYMHNPCEWETRRFEARCLRMAAAAQVH